MLSSRELCTPRLGLWRLVDSAKPRSIPFLVQQPFFHPIFREFFEVEQLPDDPRGLRRALGYPASESSEAERPLAKEIVDAVAFGKSVLQPKAAVAVHRLEIAPDEARGLVIGNLTIQGAVGGFLAPANQIAAFCVTVGSKISECSRQAMRDGDPVRAWALDAVGSWGAERMADLVHTRIVARGNAFVEGDTRNVSSLTPARHLAILDEQDRVSVRYSPGYCGVELEAQRVLFLLVDAAAIGVSLTDSCLMQPEKSVSGLIGLGPAGSFPGGGCPCRSCPEVRCSMRR